MRSMRRNLQQNQWVKSGLWLVLCFSLVLSSCSENQPEQTEIEPTREPEVVFTLPEDVVTISNLNLEITSINGTINEESLNWEDKSMSQYAVVLVDAMPFLTVQADMSDLRIFEAVSFDDDGFELHLPQQVAPENGMRVMMLTVENKDCLISGNQLTSCWDAELSSIAFMDASQNKVMEGQVLVWAADDSQHFPESVGADGLFFTDDDELLALEPGYTVVDLGSAPFTFTHQGEYEMALHSNYDPSIRDLSELTYTEAFDRIFNDMREGYAFNGIEEKEPDWDAVYELIIPQVQAAEKSGDVNAWISAVNAYTQQFSDSHVSISGDAVDDWVKEKYTHGYIYYFDLLSNGDMAYSRGTTSDVIGDRFKYYFLGYSLAEIYGTPIKEKISEVVPIFGSYSNPEMYYRAQVRDIPHTFTEKGIKFGFDNLLGYIVEDHYIYADKYSITENQFYHITYDPKTPITAYLSESGIGIITIHSDGFDVKMTMDLFNDCLANFQALGIDKILIDMRDSEEYRFMNYAGHFTGTSTEFGEMEWRQFGLADGKLRNMQLTSDPQNEQYSFEKVAILTGERCKDACEADVFALGQLPQTTVYGETSTFGSFSIVDTTPYTLPGQIAFNYSSGAIKDKDDKLLIEGTGVPFDIQIEKRMSTFLHDYDWRLQLLTNMLAYEDEMSITPQHNPRPLQLSKEEMNDLIDEFDQRDIEYLSIDAYPVLFQPINYTYRVFVQDPDQLFVSKKWCTDDPELYLYRGELLELEFIVDGELIDEDFQYIRIIDHENYKCWVKYIVLDQWDPGLHLVKINSKYISQYFFDGAHHYTKGSYSEEYTVVVKESE